MGERGDNNQETLDLLGEYGAGRSASGNSAGRRSASRHSRAQADSSVKVRSLSRSTSSSHRAAKKASSVAGRVKIAAIAVIACAVTLFVIIHIASALGGLILRSVTREANESQAESLTEESPAIEESLAAAVRERDEAFSEARLLAAQYDYEAAIERLMSIPDYGEDAEALALIEECEEIQTTLIEQDITTIPHVFFHILCVDPDTAFDKSLWGTQADGYNSLMTTVDEFRAMLSVFYESGYVLVGLHDLAHEEIGEDGSAHMVKGSILLPPGKKALVMSEDDVCYYEYMEGAGFADLMKVGDDGRPVSRYIDRDGVEHLGAYDVATILDEFIDEYPDFSYRGRKACLAFTGYNGVLGYRTDESYDPSSEYYDPSLEQGHDVEAERAEAIEVLRALYEDGYELASHSWGHRDLGAIEWERFKKDCDRWERNVATLISAATGSEPDIIIYPRGADVGDWHAYTSDNERFNYLYSLGFRYYCNVDNNQYWVQLGDTYIRQGRRALDGYNMWMDLSGQKSRLQDLFPDLGSIFDPARPTPVPSY